MATSTDCTLAADMSRRLPDVYCDWMAAVKVPAETASTRVVSTKSKTELTPAGTAASGIVTSEDKLASPELITHVASENAALLRIVARALL